MKAILTRFIGASNVRGARIKASAEGVKSLTISYPHELNTADAHRLAAEKLATRQKWGGDFCGGMLPSKDYAWTFSETKEPRKNPASDPMKYRAVVTAEKMMLGGTKRHVSSWFASRKDAENFANTVVSINKDTDRGAKNVYGVEIQERKGKPEINPRERTRKPLESRTEYVNRRSQITKRPPTKRLRTRRKLMTLMRERGFQGAFPNPDAHSVWVQIQRSGKWYDVDGYPEPVARAVAELFGKAGYTARVIRK